MDTMTYQTLKTSLEDGFLLVTIHRPEKLNALNRELIDELARMIDYVYEDPEIKAVLLTGAGDKAFVAGADIAELSQLDSAQGEALARKGQEWVFDRIEQAPKPFVAAVNGFALGGGCELAMACHFRYASEQARFGQPEVNLGLIPGYGGTQRLPRLIGRGRALELLMSGDMISADQALAMGLVNAVFPADELLDESRSRMKKLVGKSPLVLKEILDLVRASEGPLSQGLESEIQAFGRCFSTEDMKEGTRAFLEKRKPLFIGK